MIGQKFLFYSYCKNHGDYSLSPFLFFLLLSMMHQAEYMVEKEIKVFQDI